MLQVQNTQKFWYEKFNLDTLIAYAIKPKILDADAYTLDFYFRWFRLKEEFKLSLTSFTSSQLSSANNFLSCSPNVLSNHGQRSIVSITAYVS
jgi:hypothetical protein